MKEEKASGKMYFSYEVQAFPSEEGPGISVFYKEIFCSHSCASRSPENSGSRLPGAVVRIKE